MTEVEEAVPHDYMVFVRIVDGSTYFLSLSVRVTALKQTSNLFMASELFAMDMLVLISFALL